MSSINVSGISTFIHKEGNGKPTLVFVHGAACNHRLWTNQISTLSSICQVVAMDLPGHGASGRMADEREISIQSYADYLHAISSSMKLESFILIGHSMGGAISMRYALDHPHDVMALVLVGTGAKLGVSQAILEGLSKNFDQAIRVEIGELAFAKGADKRIVEEGVREMLKCDQAVALADFRACNKFDIRESVSNIQIPTLIIVGEEDKLTPVKWSEFLRSKIEYSELKLIGAAGHMVMLEKPREVNNSIPSFMKKVNKQ